MEAICLIQPSSKVFAPALLLQTPPPPPTSPRAPSHPHPSFENFITEQKRKKLPRSPNFPEVFFEARNYFSWRFSKGLSKLGSASWR